MEIQTLKKELEQNYVCNDSSYSEYDLGHLMQLARQGNQYAKLQIVERLKGLMYNSLKLHTAYWWLPEGDTLQMLNETVLRELECWDTGDPQGFCRHISYCFKNVIRNEVRRNCRHTGREISYDAAAMADTSEVEEKMNSRTCEAFFDREQRETQSFTVRELLHILTRKQQKVILAGLANKSSREIAASLQINECAVRRIRNRAIERLQNFLRSQERKSVLC